VQKYCEMATFMRCARLAGYVGTRICKVPSSGTQTFVHQSRKFCFSAQKLAELKFTKDHEWVLLDGDVCKVGLSEHAQDSLGDIVFVELPEEGTEYDQDDECGVVESVKAVSEIFCPLSGTITERNNDVVDDPAIINKDCYEKGWLFKIKLSDESQIDALMDKYAYKSFLEKQ
jgi:glycine cleavage system H protein